MYETIRNGCNASIEVSYPLQQQREDHNPAIWKQADINSANYSLQKGLTA
ncbi:MAG: hypothetical protein WDO71_21595 [Bacteroidota bacterium]